MLTGDVALVTGATRGLGRVVAHELGKAGATVAVHGRSITDAQAVADDLVAHGRRAVAVAADLALGSAACARLLEQVAGEVGPVTVLINNAADQTLTPLADSPGDEWRSVLEVNLLAAVELTRLTCLRQPDRVRVVNIASVEALAPLAGHAAYAASKAALVSFTQAAAVELAPARVNAVAPGLIDRPGLAQQWPSGWSRWVATAPSGRPVTADEVAAAVVFLASPAASGVTGVTLPVDGGWAASPRL